MVRWIQYLKCTHFCTMLCLNMWVPRLWKPLWEMASTLLGSLNSSERFSICSKTSFCHVALPLLLLEQWWWLFSAQFVNTSENAKLGSAGVSTHLPNKRETIFIFIYFNNKMQPCQPTSTAQVPQDQNLPSRAAVRLDAGPPASLGSC